MKKRFSKVKIRNESILEGMFEAFDQDSDYKISSDEFRAKIKKDSKEINVSKILR